MSSTRIRNDPIRISKENEIFTNEGRYQIDVPKWNNRHEFFQDPQIRIQTWEGNKYSNRIDIENAILSYNKPLSRDYPTKDVYTNYTPSNIKSPEYDNCLKTITDDSRAVLPPFIFRDMEINRFEEPFLNPQNNIEIPFHTNINSKLIEKDGLYVKPCKAVEMDSQNWLPYSKV
jgi:hypothetical protein